MIWASVLTGGSAVDGAGCGSLPGRTLADGRASPASHRDTAARRDRRRLPDFRNFQYL